MNEVNLDGEGNIHIILQKDKVSSAIETTRKLRGVVDSDVTMIVTGFSRREEADVGVVTSLG